MAERQSKTITRTITLSDLAPNELASIFAQYDDREQAAFFAALVEEGASFEGTGWCGQSMWMVDAMSRPAQELLATMAQYLPDDVKAVYL